MPHTDETTKESILESLKQEIVVQYPPDEILREKENFRQIIASLELENEGVSDLSKVAIIERINGEITNETSYEILNGKNTKERARITKKLETMKKHGLTWKDL